MGMSLEEYAKAHPQEVPEQPEIEETARTYHELRQERQTAEQLKNIIAGQLLTGNDPQYILYVAVQAIGILSHDEKWADDQKKLLDAAYGDILQMSLFSDSAAAEAEKLKALQLEYIEKQRRQIRRQINGCKRIAYALDEALNAINAFEPKELDED